jgi:hypothetical protein
VTALLAAAVLSAACPSTLEPEGRADAACKLLEQQGQPPAPDRLLLNALLDQPEFSRARNRNGNVAALLLKRFWAWLQGMLETQEATEFAKFAPYLVLGLAFMGVLAGVLRLRFRRSPKAKSQTAGGPEPLKLDAPQEHLSRARALLTSSPREAIREGLLALLSSLERRRYARPDRVKTNRELCAELPQRGAPEPLVREVSGQLGWYDHAFYSLSEVDPAQAKQFIEGIEAHVARSP